MTYLKNIRNNLILLLLATSCYLFNDCWKFTKIPQSTSINYVWRIIQYKYIYSSIDILCAFSFVDFQQLRMPKPKSIVLRWISYLVLLMIAVSHTTMQNKQHEYETILPLYYLAITKVFYIRHGDSTKRSWCVRGVCMCFYNTKNGIRKIPKMFGPISMCVCVCGM